MTPEHRLRELGLTLPPPRPSAGNYVGCVSAGDLLFFAAQGAQEWVGRVGRDLTLQDAQQACRSVALNLLAEARRTLGSLDRVGQVVKVVGYIACTDDFLELPLVLNGASDLFVDLFGERGRHARSAIGMQALPHGFAVEIDLILQVRAD